MPVSPALAESLAREVVAIYAEAERLLLARVALHLGAGMDAPDWVERKLAEVQFLTGQTRRLITETENRAAAQLVLDLVKAYNRGGASAVADLAKLLGVTLEEASAPLVGIPAVEALVGETMTALAATGPRILRATLDIFREVVAQTAAQVLTGVQTRRQAAQAALDRFAQKGITGFVDKAGRGWNLESYVEMAMRSGTGRAALQGHMERLEMNGQDLVIISDHGRECPLCRPHEGKVYSISGKSPGYPPLAQARSEGLWHPNCRHTANLYIPGVTRPMGATEDTDGYAAAQKQRYLERQIRAAKRMEALALDDAAKAKAGARIRSYQAKLREHVEANNLKRLRYREQIGRAV